FFQSRGVTALSLGEFDKLAPGGAVLQPLEELRARRISHPLAQVEREIDKVGRTAALQGFHRFGYFEGIADGAAERFLHRGEQKKRLHPVVPAGGLKTLRQSQRLL